MNNAATGLSTRPVTTADLPLLCTFPDTAQELFCLFPKANYPLTTQQLAEAIASRRASTVVEKDGEAVGFANLYQWEGGVCAIGNVMVAPSARGQGIGKYLIHAMLKIACTTYQANEVRIACFNHNTSTLLLYAGLGFQPFSIEQRLDKSGRKLALIAMQLTGQALVDAGSVRAQPAK